jgi:hypothetical protein
VVGLRVINRPMGQELIAELNSFEWTSRRQGNMRVDVRSKAHHGDLVIATALALWSGVGRPSGRIEVGKLEKLLVIQTAASQENSGSRCFLAAPATPR